jgi:hypothetical protein
MLSLPSYPLPRKSEQPECLGTENAARLGFMDRLQNISSQGRVPQRFHALVASVEGEDSENFDGHFHMDIPLILAKELSGFRHDDINPAVDDTPFDVLHDEQGVRPWWRLWQ